MAKEDKYHKILLPESYTWHYQKYSTTNFALSIIQTRNFYGWHKNEYKKRGWGYYETHYIFEEMEICKNHKISIIL